MLIIKIYNLNDINIYINNDCYKTNNGKLILNVKPGIYKILILNTMYIVLYKDKTIIISFTYNIFNNIRTIHLLDKYYNLLIGKGVIYLNGL